MARFPYEARIAGAFVEEVLIGLVQIDEGLLQHLGMGGFQPGEFSALLHVWQLISKGVISLVASPALVNSPVVYKTFVSELDSEQCFLLLGGVQTEPEALVKDGLFFLLAGCFGHIEIDNSGMIASAECQAAEEVLIFAIVSLF